MSPITWNSAGLRAALHVFCVIGTVYLTGGPMLLVYLLRGKQVEHSLLRDETGASLVQGLSWLSCLIVVVVFAAVFFDASRMARSSHTKDRRIGRLLLVFVSLVSLVTILALPRQMIVIGLPPRTIPLWQDHEIPPSLDPDLF